MHILYARDRITTPWKNGGGTTGEVAAFPPGAGFDSFGWRISIARVERGGPFSNFPGIDRRIALFEGRMTLAIAGQETVDVSATTVPFAFPGDAATEATLIEGPVTDLNVMTRRGRFISRMTRRHCEGTLRFDPNATTLAFPLTSVSVNTEGVQIPLAREDAIMVEPGMAQILAMPASADFYWIEIAPAA